jgi:hypothetical protein
MQAQDDVNEQLASAACVYVDERKTTTDDLRAAEEGGRETSAAAAFTRRHVIIHRQEQAGSSSFPPRKHKGTVPHLTYLHRGVYNFPERNNTTAYMFTTLCVRVCVCVRPLRPIHIGHGHALAIHPNNDQKSTRYVTSASHVYASVCISLYRRLRQMRNCRQPLPVRDSALIVIGVLTVFYTSGNGGVSVWQVAGQSMIFSRSDCCNCLHLMHVECL